MKWLGMLGGLVLLAGPAAAKVTVCDRYSAKVFAAIGYVINGDTETQGWWPVAPGQCVVVDAGPIGSPFYVMTRTDPDQADNVTVWGKGTRLVVALDGQFHDYDAETSGATDTLMAFQEVTKADVDDLPNVTWTIKDKKNVAITYDDAP